MQKRCRQQQAGTTEELPVRTWRARADASTGGKWRWVGVTVAACAMMAVHSPKCRASTVAGGNASAITWTTSLRLLLRNVEHPAGGKAAHQNGTAYVRRLRLMQGHLRWQWWLMTRPPAQRPELLRKAGRTGVQTVVDEAFSPSRRDRAAATLRLAGMSGNLADTLLNVLLMDSSRYVRLCTMGAFWRRPPDGLGTAELFWLALEAGSEKYTFHHDSRTWSLRAAEKVKWLRVRYHGSRLVFPARVSQQRFSLAEKRQAADLITHWHSSALGSLLLEAIRVKQETEATPIESPWQQQVPVYNQTRFLRIFCRCRPKGMKSELLALVEQSDVHTRQWLSPQGRGYFRSNRTDPLCLLMIDEGLNPTHYGIVKIGCSAAQYSPPEICAFSRHQQLADIQMVRKLCKARGIKPATKNPTASTVALFEIGTATTSHHGLSLTELQYGLLNWLIWVRAMPPAQRTAMLDWAYQRANVELAAMAFGPTRASKLGAARLLAAHENAPSQRLLAHLVANPSQAVSLTAMNAFWRFKADAAALAVLQRLAAAPKFTPWPSALAVTPKAWRVTLDGQSVLVRKRCRNIPFWLTRSAQHRKLLDALLAHQVR